MPTPSLKVAVQLAGPELVHLLQAKDLRSEMHPFAILLQK